MGARIATAPDRFIPLEDGHSRTMAWTARNQCAPY